MNRFVFALLAGLALAGSAVVQTSDTKVLATAKATKPAADGKQTVTITLAVEKGWYIYANPINNNTGYEGNETKTTIKAKEKVKATFKYPAGKAENRWAAQVRHL